MWILADLPALCFTDSSGRAPACIPRKQHSSGSDKTAAVLGPSSIDSYNRQFPARNAEN